MPDPTDIASDPDFALLLKQGLGEPSADRGATPAGGTPVLGPAPRLVAVPAPQEEDSQAHKVKSPGTSGSARKTTVRTEKDTKPTGKTQLEPALPPADAPVHIPRRVRARLRRDLGEVGLTIGERVVLAFNRQYPRFNELFGRPSDTVLGPMPARRSRRRRRDASNDLVQLRMSLDEHQLEVLDSEVARYDLNRSLFVSTLLDADLPDFSDDELTAFE